MGKKRISFQRTNCRVSSVAGKGHFVIYTVDQIRFELPLAYLSNSIFNELFKLSEEEFGISSGGPITFPCDSIFMNYVVSLIQQGLAKDLEMALLNSISLSHCDLSAPFHQRHAAQQMLVCSC